MADAAGQGRDVRSGGNAAGGACSGGDVLTRAIGRCTSFWQTSKAPENRAFFLEPDPLQAIEQAEQAGKKQAAKWAAPQFEAIRIAPP